MSDIVPVGEVWNMLELAGFLWCKIGCLLLQGNVGMISMESSYREDGTQIIRWEETVFVSKGVDNIIKAYTIVFAYILSLLVSVANKIEKLQKNFLWGGIGEEVKLHLVCTPNC